jgi:hypothetical protein
MEKDDLIFKRLVKVMDKSVELQKKYGEAGYELWIWRFPDQDLHNGQFFSGKWFYINGDRWV